MKAYAKFLCLCCAMGLSACTGKAVLFNLDTNAISNLEFDDYGVDVGKMRGVLPNGLRVAGEYSLISRETDETDPFQSSDHSGEDREKRIILSSGQELESSGKYNWATEMGFSFASEKHWFGGDKTWFGTATLVGGQLTIECIYRRWVQRGRQGALGAIIAPGAAYHPIRRNGVCRDNKGGKYKLNF